MLKDVLLELRTQKGCTQTQVATMLNITRQAYNHYETGARIPPTDSIDKLANVFSVTADYLLGREEKDTKKVRSSEDERTLELLAEYPEVGTIVDIMTKLPLSAQKELAEYAKFRADQLEKEHQK